MRKIIYLSCTICLFLAACEPYFSGLDIKNDHEPDISTVMGDINQYPSLIGGAYNNWWHHMLAANDGDTWTFSTNSDAMTAGAGNWNLQTYYYRTDYEKPMIDNTDQNAGFPKTLWYNHYSKISTVFLWQERELPHFDYRRHRSSHHHSRRHQACERCEGSGAQLSGQMHRNMQCTKLYKLLRTIALRRGWGQHQIAAIRQFHGCKSRSLSPENEGRIRLSRLE